MLPPVAWRAVWHEHRRRGCIHVIRVISIGRLTRVFTIVVPVSDNRNAKSIVAVLGLQTFDLEVLRDLQLGKSTGRQKGRATQTNAEIAERCLPGSAMADQWILSQSNQMIERAIVNILRAAEVVAICARLNGEYRVDCGIAVPIERLLPVRTMGGAKTQVRQLQEDFVIAMFRQAGFQTSCRDVGLWVALLRGSGFKEMAQCDLVGLFLRVDTAPGRRQQDPKESSLPEAQFHHLPPRNFGVGPQRRGPSDFYRQSDCAQFTETTEFDGSAGRLRS